MTNQVVLSSAPNRRAALVAALAADYKARGIDRQAAYGQFVRDRSLQPEIDNSAFLRVWDAVAPRLLMGETRTVDFVPTHRDTLANRLVQVTPDEHGHAFVWENGMTGFEPGMLSARYEAVS